MTDRYQRSWVEISKSALIHNIGLFKKLTGPNAILAPVLKANAYGHGLHEVASVCQQLSDVDWICVALLSDALALRKSGFAKRLLVIGILDTDPVQALDSVIHLFVYSYAQAQELSYIAEKHKSVFDVHIKIDTGLSRLGLMHTHAVALIEKIVALPGLRVVGVYSHCAQAQAEDTLFSRQQIAHFGTVITGLQSKNIQFPYIHMANSAATMRFTIPGCNLFRVGAGIYGLWPSQQARIDMQTRIPDCSLQPVLHWKTRIMYIQHVQPGSFIGYNGTHQVDRATTIAVLPVGYHDGYDIQFSNRGSVKIGQQYAPIVGRICMNHMMVDVTAIAEVYIGQEVTIIGPEPPIDVYSLAQLSGNNNIREVLVHISASFARIIVE